jgi:hypothetical protein
MNPFTEGYSKGREDGNYLSRAEAFGAIRQAVSVAREHDKRAAKCLDYIDLIVLNGKHRKHDDWLSDLESDTSNVWWHRSCASAVRDAIRAAIGSETG